MTGVCAAVLFTVGTLLACGDAWAQSPAEAAVRDANEFAACMIAADIECVDRFSDYELFADLSIRDAAWIQGNQSRGLQTRKDSGWSYFTFELGELTEPFAHRGRLFTFIPYIATHGTDVWQQRTAFFIGVSDDSGASWRFINGLMTSPPRMAEMFPASVRSRFPAVDLITRAYPKPERSRYLKTDDGYFQVVGEGAAYRMRFEVRRNIREPIDLTITFDDPSKPQRPVVAQAVLVAGQENFEFTSPLMDGFVNGQVYQVLVAGWDPVSGEEVFEHIQPVLYRPPGLTETRETSTQ